MHYNDVPLRPGDQVKLNSSDLKMIVRNVTLNQAQCIWFDMHHQFNELECDNWLPFKTLTRLSTRSNVDHVIALGDRVELKSGGPRMTVCDVYRKQGVDPKYSYTKCVYLTTADKMIFLEDIPARGLKRL